MANNDSTAQLLTAAQCRAARALIDITARDLADVSGVSTATIQRFETGSVPRPLVMKALRAAFETQGVEFVDVDQDAAMGRGVRFSYVAEVGG